jgi:hypothetical protein
MKLILLIALSFSGHLCIAQEIISDPTVEYSKKDFKIRFPTSWKIDTSGTMGSEIFGFSPLESQTDRFRENVNVLVQNLSGQNIDLDKYKQITDMQIAKLFTDGKVIESVVVNSDKKDFYKVAYEFTQESIRLKIRSICYIQREKAYLVTFTSELTKDEQYQQVGEALINSFSLQK